MVEIVSLLKDFMGGVHPEQNKWTKVKEIERAELPEKVALPLRQHIGAVCEPNVEPGDHVKAGEKIAESDHLSSTDTRFYIWLSQEITPWRTPSCPEVDSVVIESDGEDDIVRMEPLDWEDCHSGEIVDRVREAGITGLGGASFPTHVKLNPPEDTPVDTVVINGAECEPFITVDHRLMVEEGEAILEGSKILKKTVGADRIMIGIEDNKPDAIKNLEELSGEDVEIVSLESRYPQGDEYHMLKAMLDREVPSGKLPFSVGALVQNVGTTKAIHDAVVEGKPMIERPVTVTGDVQEPKNLLARFGTLYMDLVEQCGGPTEEISRLFPEAR